MNEFEYLPTLTKTEFKAIAGILKKRGMRGLLGISLELAQFNLDRDLPAQDLDRAERVSRELGALIERMDGFEQLAEGK